MTKNVSLIISVASLVLLIAGCRTSDVEMKTYWQDRQRVDQDISGNAGYLYGSPKQEDLQTGKPTRKVFVVEVTKDVKSNLDDDLTAIEKPVLPPKDPQMMKEPVATKRTSPLRDLDIPNFDNEMESEPQTSTPGMKMEYVDYTVQKNDTLQKISKKFYNSYSKWPKIYEVNKDKIDNPDSIKPGIVIKVPVQK